MAPLREYFSGWKAAEVNAAAWDRYVVERRRRDQVANATLNRALCFLLRAFRLGLERHKVAQVPIIHSLKESAPRQGFLERTAFEAIVQYLDPVVALGCRIAYTLAWRRGEVFTLERRHVNLETGALTLEKTKNGDARRAYLPADLVAELREHLAKVDALQVRLGRVFRRVFVYTGRWAGHQVGDFRVAWEQACKAAGRPGAIFHDLRRSGVRNMVRAGVSETVAMKISGHRTSSMFRRYNITSDEDLRAVAERMGMSLGITEPGPAKTRLVSLRSS
jgi:integrase